VTGDMPPHRAPEFLQISLDILQLACRRAAADIRRAPLCGIFFQAVQWFWGGYWCVYLLKRGKAIVWFWPWADFP